MKKRHVNGSAISLATAVLSWIFVIIYIFSWSLAVFFLAFCSEILAVLYGYLFIFKGQGSDKEEMKAMTSVILGSTSFLVLMTSLFVFTWQLGNMLDSIYKNWW